MKNDNKGFSLIELIVVIAIMAILVGALAPQLIKYIDRSRAAADTQVLGSVYTAVQTAVVDPEVGLVIGTGIDKDIDQLDTLTNTNHAKFTAEVTDTLGGDLTKVQDSLKSTKTSGGKIHIKVEPNGAVTIKCGAITVDASGSSVS